MVNVKKLAIKSITKLDEQRQVFDLSVEDTHNFFISTPAGRILTHNCDHITPDAQAALRNLMETYSDNARFILTSNYLERVSPPIISQSQVFELNPPTKKEVAYHLVDILQKENVTFAPADVAILVDEYFPDIRRIINAAQQCSNNGKLEIDKTTLASGNINEQILEILKSNLQPVNKVNAIRTAVIGANIRELMHSGRSQKQSIAIAMSKAGKSRKKRKRKK